MKTLTFIVSGLAALALGVAAQAETKVKIADLDLASAAGQAAFNQRVEHAAQAYCAEQRDLSQKHACLTGVRLEANEKLSLMAQRGQVRLAGRN